jgi:hypothetical protein
MGLIVPDQGATNFSIQVPKANILRAAKTLGQLLATDDQKDRCVSSAFDWGSEPFRESMCNPATMTSTPTTGSADPPATLLGKGVEKVKDGKQRIDDEVKGF